MDGTAVLTATGIHGETASLTLTVGDPAPSTSEAPAPTAENESAVRIGSYKESSLPVGERSLLLISNAGAAYTVASSAPAVLDVEQVAGNWVAVAKAAGTAAITVTTASGEKGTLSIMVTGSSDPEPSISWAADLDANMEVREEIIALVNKVRLENGVRELTINDALMAAAQTCSDRLYTWHHTQEECEAAMAYGYPNGFGSNLTVFTGAAAADAAKQAVTNWVNSPGHFQTMIDPDCDTIGVGVAADQYKTVCYLFVGDPNSHNPYE